MNHSEIMEIKNRVIECCRVIENDMNLVEHEIIFQDDLDCLGKVNFKYNIIYINTKLLDLELFSYKELISTIIHEYIHAYCYKKFKQYRVKREGIIFGSHSLLFTYYLLRSKIFLVDSLFPLSSLPNAINNNRFNDWWIEFKECYL